MGKKKRYFSRAERKEQIINLFVSWLKSEMKHNWFTTYKVARGLGMVRSSQLQRMLDELVSEGLLISRTGSKPGRKDGVFYSLNPKEYPVPKAREIVINGKAWAIQAMFS